MADSGLDRQSASHESSHRGLPREIAPGVHWTGGCLEVFHKGQHVHLFISTFLVMGPEKSILIDTGNVEHWAVISEHLDDILDGRPIDYLFPTHPEIAHAGNLARLMERHPDAVVVGDVRDYHVYFPEYAHRLKAVAVGDSISLGGDSRFVVLPAPIRDLPSTVWGYETSRQIMFVGDGLAYVHPRPEATEFDVPVHRRGECGLLDRELPTDVTVDAAEFVTRAALPWSRYADASAIFDELDALLRAYPSAMVAPGHGNVITDPEHVARVLREAFRLSFTDQLELFERVS